MSKNIPKCNRMSTDRCIQCNFPRSSSIHYFRKDSLGRPLCNRCGLLNLRKKRKRGESASTLTEVSPDPVVQNGSESLDPGLDPRPCETTIDIELDVAALLRDMDVSIPGADPQETRPVLFSRAEQEIPCLFTRWIGMNPNEEECILALLDAIRMYGDRRSNLS